MMHIIQEICNTWQFMVFGNLCGLYLVIQERKEMKAKREEEKQ